MCTATCITHLHVAVHMEYMHILKCCSECKTHMCMSHMYSCCMCVFDCWDGKKSPAALNIFESVLRLRWPGVSEFMDSNDRRLTAHPSMLSKPASHLVKACPPADLILLHRWKSNKTHISTKTPGTRSHPVRLVLIKKVTGKWAVIRLCARHFWPRFRANSQAVLYGGSQVNQTWNKRFKLSTTTKISPNVE